MPSTLASSGNAGGQLAETAKSLRLPDVSRAIVFKFEEETRFVDRLTENVLFLQSDGIPPLA